MKPFNIIQVVGPLFLSNKVWPDRDFFLLRRHGIGAIVNLTEDHTYDVSPPMVCLNAGFTDGSHTPFEQLHEIYSFIDQHLQRTRVLVHCAAGVSRSAGIVIGQLMRENPGWTWDQALAAVHRKRSVWVAVETRESVQAFLDHTSPAPGDIRERDRATLGLLQRYCPVPLRQVSTIGWNTRGYVIEDGHVVGLGLFALDLSFLPKEIGRLKMVRDLFLCDNRLEELPGEISELCRLQTLNLSGNRLRSLPGEIRALSQMNVLNAARNRLHGIPAEISKLGGLDRLYLHDNSIAKLPESIVELAIMTELYLQNNRLTRLPADVDRLSRLRSLAVNGNEIRTLPGGIGRLPAITALNLSKNLLAALPDEIGLLTQLDNLNISSNRLQALPDDITALYELRRLNIALNRLADLPPGIERWLKQLHRNGCIVLRENTWHD